VGEEVVGEGEEEVAVGEAVGLGVLLLPMAQAATPSLKGAD
jgi:hypothetical protein